MPDALVFDSVRTPRGKGKNSGALYTVRPVNLLTTVLEALRERNALDTRQIDDVKMGCVTQTQEQGACIARLGVMEAGYHTDVPAVTLNRFCGSGLEAINEAAAYIKAGFCDLCVAGGVESMSRVKMGADGGAMFDPHLQWKTGAVPQGISADLLATIENISREEADAFALRSHQRAVVASEQGLFGKSMIAVKDINGFTLLDHDELPRTDTTMEALAGLKPSFEMMGKAFGLDHLTKRGYPQVESIRHVHTAGNSSGIVDGAAAVLLANKEKGESLGLKARAKVLAIGLCAEDPLLMLTGPIPATQRALDQAGMKIDDIDLFEVNEAFAAVPLVWQRHYEVNSEKLNIHGGAIALGHPLGATGAAIFDTLLDALEEKDLNTGLVTLCIGGGMGIATIIERV